jgi:hypothetical protein
MAKQKQTQDEKNAATAMLYLANIPMRMKEDPDGFWQKRFTEIIPMYKKMLEESPQKTDDILAAFAWHTFTYALKQR